MENKIIVSRKDLKSIEVFMGYADGYLSEKITWNDLMPVVEKIEGLNFDTRISSATNILNGDKTRHFIAEIETIMGFEVAYIIGAPTKIETTYSAVIRFINWYNTHTNGK